MRRARRLNIRYSEGFSPHQIMSFAAPLGVGLTSNGEYLDIEVTDDETSSPSSAVMVERLNAAMVEGIEVLSYRKLPDNAKNAMSIVAAADYTLRFRPGYGPEDQKAFWERLAEFLERPSIEIIKTTKKGEALVDIKPHIHEYRAGDDSLHPFGRRKQRQHKAGAGPRRLLRADRRDVFSLCLPGAAGGGLRRGDGSAGGVW